MERLRRVGGKEVREVYYCDELVAECPRCGERLDGRYVYVDGQDPVLWEYHPHSSNGERITLVYHVGSEAWYRKPTRDGLQ